MASPEFHDRMLSLGLARVSEAAAIACAPLVGRGDEKAADQAAVDAMRTQLDLLDIAGTVVIGEGERDEAPMLYIGEKVGPRDEDNLPEVDIAVDPLEGTNLCADGGPGSLAVLAAARRGELLAAPDTYMAKIATCPEGQVCDEGACREPEPGECVVDGAPCGPTFCEGNVAHAFACEEGQDGESQVLRGVGKVWVSEVA